MSAKQSIAYRARYILPVVEPPIEDGCVEIERGRIVAVGPWRNQSPVQDLGDAIILPAPVNAHTHLEFSQLTMPLGKPKMPFPDWIRQVLTYRAEQEQTEAETTYALSCGIDESLKSGTRCLGEIATSQQVPHAIHWAAGVRFLELIGLSQLRMEQQAAVASQFLSPLPSTQLPDGWRRGLSPHAPYTVGIPLFEHAVGLSEINRAPIAMHLAESPEELQLLRENDGPFRELLEERGVWVDTAFSTTRRPLDYLQRLSQAARALVIHGNYLEADEQAFLADHADRMSLVYCPRTHAFFGFDAYPLEKLLAKGVHIAIGTDSRASNPDLNMWHELRFLAQQFPKLDRGIVLQLGTLNSATALGDIDQRGQITPGAIAELITLPYQGTKPLVDLWSIETEPTCL